jgi:methylenetetrahydrofolate reductase (NADPH)
MTTIMAGDMSETGTSTRAADRDVARDEAIARITAFMGRCSIEATRPKDADVALLRATLPRATDIFLTAVPRRPLEEVIAAAKLVHAAGFHPVPHIAARAFATIAAARAHLERLRGEADVDTVLVIGGDLAQPAGDILGAHQLIESGVVRAAGMERVGIAGHPDGHPVMSDEELESTLVTKIASAQSSGLNVEIVTQFCFEPRAIIRWIGWLRERGVHLPVKVGLAGPTNLMTWLNYARRCGVRASAQALARRSGLVKQVFNAVAPDSIVRALADATAEDRLGDVSPHLFSFGGIGPTARWAAGATHGAITLDKEGGFNVEPFNPVKPTSIG